MASFALPVWLALQEELLGPGGAAPNSFDDFDDDALFQMFHLTRPCIAFITDAVCIRMKTVTVDPPALSVDAAVMVALNYYAHGISSADVLQRLGSSQADFPGIICTVSAVIAGMADQFISFPLLRDARTNVANSIKRVCGIPNVLGVLAPAHFKIRASPYEKETFRSFVNSLGYTSVVSQFICDSDGNILSVEKCCVGSTFEQELWDSSFKGREMEEELHGPYCVIGGNGYRLTNHVLTPVSEPANYHENRFNEAHAKIHNVMRTTLGSMKRRFRCLMQLGFAKECSLDKKANVIKACSVLHNIAKKFSVAPPPVAGKVEPLHPGKQPSGPVTVNREAFEARRELIYRHFSIYCKVKAPLDEDA
ncbi:putative nuclease HARBI1 [Liparis tanakae]|uniref:Putative nuclease HARBI1 n=1 Tax=Liparis tanakae TaxID=230148 RepID=A0A4Z2IS03_9TELE|nr:putative nuclease HARBI1 [Liparis tanakae]